MARSAVAYAPAVAKWQSKWEKVLAEAKKAGQFILYRAILPAPMQIPRERERKYADKPVSRFC